MQQLTYSKIVTLSPTLSTSAYADGDQVSTPQAVNLSRKVDFGAGTAILQSVALLDKALQSVTLELWFFQNSPTLANGDNGVFSITDANMAAAVPLGVVSVASTTYKSAGANSVATVANIGLILGAAASQTVYCQLVSRATPTYAASDIVINLGILQD